MVFERLIELLPADLIVKIWQILPESKTLRRLLMRYANTRFTVGVIGLIKAKNDDLLIVRHTYKATPWGLPAGALKREPPLEGLKREVFEETGFTIEPIGIADVVFIPEMPELLIVIRARLMGGLFLPSSEVSEFMFIHPPEGLERLSEAQREIVCKYY